MGIVRKLADRIELAALRWVAKQRGATLEQVDDALSSQSLQAILWEALKLAVSPSMRKSSP